MEIQRCYDFLCKKFRKIISSLPKKKTRWLLKEQGFFVVHEKKRMIIIEDMKSKGCIIIIDELFRWREMAEMTEKK